MLNRDINGDGDMNHPSYGSWLRMQRRLHGLRQADLEEKAGLGYSHVSKIERGVLRMPTEEVRQRIHEVLGTSEEDLVNAGVLTRLKMGGLSVLVAANDVDSTDRTIFDPDSPSYHGNIRLDDVVDEFADAARDVSWTRSMLDTVIKQVEMFRRVKKGDLG